MPIRLLPLIAALAVLLVLPAGAQASGYVPDEVIVRYEDGHERRRRRPGHRGAPAPRRSRRCPGGSEQLQIEDGDSVRETIAELRADPNVAYAVPNWRARAAASAPNDPAFRLQWNLFGAYGHQRGRGLDARGGPRRARRPRRRGRGARQRRGLRAPRALPARARPPPLDLRAAVRLHRARPPSERRVRPRHARVAGRSPRRPTTAWPRPGSPTTRRSCRCACSTRTARATRPRSRAPSATPPATAPT